MRYVDRWPKGGARNFRDLATPTPAPLEGRIYTCGVDLDSVDFDKVITHPSLYKRNVGKSQTAQAIDRPRGHRRLKKIQMQHPVIQRKERRLKTIFTELARELKSKRTMKYDHPGARLNREQRIRWRRIEHRVSIQNLGPELKIIKTRECRKPDVMHNRAERACWGRELKTFTSKIWQESAHPRRTQEQEGEAPRARLYRLLEVYDMERGYHLAFVKLDNSTAVGIEYRLKT